MPISSEYRAFHGGRYSMTSDAVPQLYGFARFARIQSTMPGVSHRR